ncbi:FlgD immunoglobulin-like domain containing protein [Asticcacaulis sp.]|uniref:flagellar hook assembly protein FlgD n=1 Tax=Asticcacaulis sp. TaxID=1872648 RepID=UPI002607D286|nr:FlgD immunoglobulin-like domain containing protein [Asticcacaulis sp.]
MINPPNLNNQNNVGTDNGAQKKLTATYQTFLTLLTTQIKNQDPLSPMDSTQWTSQLVQYSSVEQQLKANELLTALVGLQAGNLTNAANMIGKNAIVDSATQSFTDKPLAWNYDLESDAAKVRVEVVDAKGNTVFRSDVGKGAKGTNSFTWDGKDASGKTLPQGDYTLKVTAETAAGGKVKNAVYFQDRVSGIEKINGEIYLKVASTLVPLSKVSGVKDPQTPNK